MEVVVEGRHKKYSLFHYRTRKATKLCGSCWSTRGPLRRACRRGMSCLTTRSLWCSPLRRASLGLRYRAVFLFFIIFPSYLSLSPTPPPQPACTSSVADPELDPDPPDLTFLTLPDLKPQVRAILWFFWLPIYWNQMSTYFQQYPISLKNIVRKLCLCWHLRGQWRKYQYLDPVSGSGSESGYGFIIQRHGSGDPDSDPDPPLNEIFYLWNLIYNNIVTYVVIVICLKKNLFD